MRIVDCHAHFGRFAPTNIVCHDAASTLRTMDRAGVEKLCLSAFLSIGPDCRAGNRLLAEAVRSHPDRLVGYAVINPNRPAEISDELERCFQDYGFGAIKLHPALHRYPIDGPAYQPVLDYAARHRLTVLSHEWGPPATLERLATTYAGANLILAHTGFWDARGAFPYADLLRRRPNVFVDLVYSNIYYDGLERMVEQVGAEKILWGSDFPLHDLPYQLGRMLFARLEPADLERILGANMLRLLEQRPML